MKKLLFLFLLLALGLSSVKSQSFQSLENDELRDSLEQFTSSRTQLSDPFLFSFKGKEMLVYRSETRREADNCYAYFTVSPPQGCVDDSFEIRTVFVTGLGPWHVVYTPGGITTPVFTHIATGPFAFNATATDANNCQVTNSQPISAQVNPMPSLSTSTLGKPCYNIYIANTNGCQSDVMWSNGDAGLGGDYSNYTGGVAIVTVEALGCTNSDTIVLNPPCAVVDTLHFPVYDTIPFIWYDTVGCGGGNGGTVPTPNFIYSSDDQECGPDTVYFYDASSGNPTTWSWNFPGGTPSSSTEQNPMIVYKFKGTFSVSLAVSNNNGTSDPISFPSIIHIKGVAPIVSASANPPVIMAGDYSELSSLVLNGTSNYKYEWDHGSSLDNSAHQNPYAWPVQTTLYTVKVTDLATLCVSYASTKVTVPGTVANHEIDPDQFQIVNDLGSKEIRIKTSLRNYQVIIYDVTGRIFQYEDWNEDETILPTDDLVSGAYFLGIILGNDAYSKTIAVIN